MTIMSNSKEFIMFSAIGQLFRAIFAAASTAERIMVSVDNVAKVGQAHSVNLLNETLDDLDIKEEDLTLDKAE